VNESVPYEIMNQLTMSNNGMGRLKAMVGAKNFVVHNNYSGISFKFANKGARQPNYIKITLNAMDTYDVEFGRIWGMDYKVIEKLEGIYNDQLKELFEKCTGLYLSL